MYSEVTSLALLLSLNTRTPSLRIYQSTYAYFSTGTRITTMPRIRSPVYWLSCDCET